MMKSAFVALALLSLLFTTVTAQEAAKLKSSEIPKTVMSGLKAKFPRAVIDKCTKEKENGMNVYDIEFKVSGHGYEADISEAGVIQNWEKAIPVRQLPARVRSAAAAEYPKSMITEAMAVTAVNDGKDALDGYELNLKDPDGTRFELTISPSGTIVEDSKKEKKE